MYVSTDIVFYTRVYIYYNGHIRSDAPTVLDGYFPLLNLLVFLVFVLVFFVRDFTKVLL